MQNNKFYIGSSKDVELRCKDHQNRLKSGKHINKHLQSSWNKYGESTFLFKTIETCSLENLIKLEQKYIDEYKACKNGYNLNPIAGSCSGCKRKPCSKEHRLKISEASKKRWSDPEYRERAIEERKNRAKTKKGREQLLKANKLGAVARAKHYIITSPEGKEYKVHNLAAFCREHGLNRQSMGDVVKGRVPQCYGWMGKELLKISQSD